MVFDMKPKKDILDYDLDSPELEIFSKIDPKKNTPKRSGWQELLAKGYVRAGITLTLLFSLFGSTFFIALKIRKPSFKTASADIGYIPEAQIDIPKPEGFMNCSELAGNPENLNFLNSYCQGNFCVNNKDKETCEVVDVLVIDNGFLSNETGQDGIGDCIWSGDENLCKPKY